MENITVITGRVIIKRVREKLNGNRSDRSPEHSATSIDQVKMKTKRVVDYDER